MAGCTTDTVSESLKVTSTQQGLDRCASLLKSLLSPTKIPQTHSNRNLISPLLFYHVGVCDKTTARCAYTQNKNHKPSTVNNAKKLKKYEPERNKKLSTTKKRKPVPVAMSTPQNNSFETHALSQPVVCMTPYGVQNFNLSKEYQEPQCYYKPFSLPLIWLPPHYQLIDTKQSHNDEK